MTDCILVVDDEPDLELLVTQNFRRQIRRGEISFLFAHDGVEALNILEDRHEVQVVLSDINMPRMDGLTLLDALSERNGDLAAVIVSAYGDMGNIRTAMNRGAFDFLTKPIEFDDLEATIEKTLGHIQHLRELHEEKDAAEKSRAVLARYFSPAVAEALGEDANHLDSGGERREATFMFTDLADFTPLIENTDPKLIFPLLNDYLDGLTDIVFRHGGTVTKIVGDAVHVMFGAPLEMPDHAARAVQCALAIDQFAEAFKTEKQAAGLPLGSTRIGINTGRAVIGNFGGDTFQDYTAHGDAVNTAARLETVNKQLGTRICVSATTVARIEDFQGRPVGDLVLKGKTDHLQAYEPLSAETAQCDATTAYCAAFEKLRSKDPAAYQDFAALVGTYGTDPLADFHLRRLLVGETGATVTFEEK